MADLLDYAFKSTDEQQLPYQQESTFRWATVKGLSPLTIRFDGDTQDFGASPDSLVSGMVANDRVWCQLFGRKVIILGVGVQ